MTERDQRAATAQVNRARDFTGCRCDTDIDGGDGSRSHRLGKGDLHRVGQRDIHGVLRRSNPDDFRWLDLQGEIERQVGMSRHRTAGNTQVEPRRIERRQIDGSRDNGSCIEAVVTRESDEGKAAAGDNRAAERVPRSTGYRPAGIAERLRRLEQ